MRRRLVVAISGVAVPAVLLFAIPLALALGRAYRDDALLRLQRDTVARTRSIDLGRRGDPIEFPRGGDDLAVYDLSGARVAGRGPARADVLVRNALASGRATDEHGASDLLVAVPLLTNEHVTGAVRAVRNDAVTVAKTHRAWVLLAGLGVAILLVAVIAARVLGARLARPLERVAAAASRLGHGDFTVRAPRARIAEVDAVAGALDVTAERLAGLIARERAFTADASHQLRTPLAALRLELEALELDGESRPELVAAMAQAERLETTIDTMLALARDVPLTREAAALAPILDQVAADWRGELATAGRPLRVHLPPTPVAVRASPLVVREILTVLLSNAARHGQGPVDITVRPLGAYTAVDVSDAGPGFSLPPDDALARRTGSGAGHGIGLALAHSLAAAEGGRLDIVHPGPRPVVSLLLPAAEVAGPRPAASAASADAAS